MTQLSAEAGLLVPVTSMVKTKAPASWEAGALGIFAEVLL
jgi:hypothetical protein